MSDRKKNSLSPLSLHAQVRLCPKVKNCQCRNVISASFFSVNWFVSVFLQRDFFLFSWFSCSSVLYLIPQSLFQGFRKFITVLTYYYLYLRVVGFYLNFRFFMHQNKQDKFFVCENLLGTELVSDSEVLFGATSIALHFSGEILDFDNYSCRLRYRLWV